MTRAALLAVLALAACSQPEFHLRADVATTDAPDLDLSYQGQPVPGVLAPDGATHWKIDEHFASYQARMPAVRELVVSRAGVEVTRIPLMLSFCRTAKVGGDPIAEDYTVLLHADGVYCWVDQKCEWPSGNADYPMMCN